MLHGVTEEADNIPATRSKKIDETSTMIRYGVAISPSLKSGKRISK